jgi:hypothetical protein
MSFAATQLAYTVLWCAHPVLLLAVSAAMLRRQLHRAFPVFFAYNLFQVAVFAVVFPCYEAQLSFAYFYAYWIGAMISLVIGFKVIHEVFLDVFRPFHTLKDLGTLMFKWAALVMLLVAGVVAAANSSSADSPLVQAVLTVQRCVRVIQVGLILFLLVFAKYLGVSRRQPTFGIALGFGGFASVELFLVALHISGHLRQTTISLLNMVAYNLSILLWLGYTLLKRQVRESTSTLLMSQRWEQSLTDLHAPLPADSLIPAFENMVNRAFTRNPLSTESAPIAPEQASGTKSSAASAPGNSKS